MDTAAANRNKNRWMLLGVTALFVVPILIALTLNLVGWRPQGTKAYGTLIDPPQNIGGTIVTAASGQKYPWKTPQWYWTLLALPGAQCAEKCLAALEDAMRMRATLGRNAERVRVLYLGPALPAEKLGSLAPLEQGHDDGNAFATWRARGDDALALALVDPNGYLMLGWPEGYDIAGVRRDLPKVVK